MLPAILALALLAAVYAPSAYALVRVVRRIPWVERRLDRKPWGCDACMSAWSSLAVALAGAGVVLGAVGWREALVALVAAAPASGLVLLALDWSAAHAPAPPMLPPEG